MPADEHPFSYVHVSKAFALARALDRAGLRHLVAKVASLVYRDQNFSVDEKGRWVSTQRDCTVVSTTIFAMPYSAVRSIVCDHWCRYYDPRAGDVVIDVGAGIGDQVVAFSKMVGPFGKVVAIEAHPETFECLQMTIARSGLTNVVAVHCAIADADGEVAISDIAEPVHNSIVAAHGTRKVPQKTLDSLARDLGLDTIALLKMNIEGAEKLAVLGMVELSPNIRNVAISCHDFVADVNGDDSFRSKVEVVAALKQQGFAVRGRPAQEGEPWFRDYVYGSK